MQRVYRTMIREAKEVNKPLFVFLLISLAVAVAFSVVVLVLYQPVLELYGPDGKSYEKLWDWLIAVGGTLLSFIIGLAGGALHLQVRRKNRLRHLLKAELCETLDVGNNNTQPTLTYIHPLVVEEAVKSGLFDPKLTTDMLRLAKMYHTYNNHVTTLRAAREPGSIGLPQSLVDNIKRCRKHVLNKSLRQ